MQTLYKSERVEPDAGRRTSDASRHESDAATAHAVERVQRRTLRARRRIKQARGAASIKRTARSVVAVVCLGFLLLSFEKVAQADEIRLTNGMVIEADETWEDAQGVWYRRGGITHLLERERVRGVERRQSEAGAGRVETKDADEKAGAKSGAKTEKKSRTKAVLKTVEGDVASSAQALPTVWIYLVGGARMEVDEATESAEGVWYRRGNLSIFVERVRIERVERELPVEASEEKVAGTRPGRRERFWTTGSRSLDSLIRQNGAAYGVDPYLIFLVMEQESHFNSRALSPKGARGLMQLMPGTAARFGVRNAADPAQNIRGGTRYLKELLKRFGGRVDLVLAGYNAGEGAVLKYGHRVPPYRETRNYVRRISARYSERRVSETALTRERAGGMR
ncbi:MAG TPA: lytic transglycosylase domain-containing protein [Pyrinomonadaceae bacterium]|jgi:Zn-finger nucleic acid-binding protein